VLAVRDDEHDVGDDGGASHADELRPRGDRESSGAPAQVISASV